MSAGAGNERCPFANVILSGDARNSRDVYALGSSACPYVLLVLGLSRYAPTICCTYFDLVALLEMRLKTALCHLLRLLDLRGSHV
jgi:hypothetical protein